MLYSLVDFEVVVFDIYSDARWLQGAKLSSIIVDVGEEARIVI